MNFNAPYTIPATPPADLLAELDAAATALDRLTARAEELTFAMDQETRGLRIEHSRGSTTRQLSSSQLFELLSA